jgi:transcriptional regulator with XRE-family HTH domain
MARISVFRHDLVALELRLDNQPSIRKRGLSTASLSNSTLYGVYRKAPCMALCCLLGLAMETRDAVAGVLRAVRKLQGLSHDDLADAAFRTYLGRLERGQSNATLEKLDELAVALEFDPVALIALAFAQRSGERVDVVLKRALGQAKNFESNGGLELIASEFEGHKLTKRRPGQPRNTTNEQAVRDLKSAGYTQAEIVKQLGLTASTVYKHWKRIEAEDAAP